MTVHYTDGEVVTFGSDGTWRTRRAEWLAAPQRNNDSGDFVEWIDGRLNSDRVVGRRFRRPTLEHRPRTRDRWARHRSPICMPSARGSAEHIVPPASVRTLPTGLGGRRLRQGLRRPAHRLFRHGMSGHTVPMHVGYTLDPDGSVSTTHNTQGTDLSFSYIQRAGAQTFEPYWYLGFRYLQIDDPGETIGAAQVALVARHAAMPDLPHGDLHLVQPHARRGVGALRALGALHVPGAVHRHPDQGEGPVPLGRRQRVPDGHAHLRRPEPELAGTPRHGTGPGPLLALPAR